MPFVLLVRRQRAQNIVRGRVEDALDRFRPLLCLLVGFCDSSEGFLGGFGAAGEPETVDDVGKGLLDVLGVFPLGGEEGGGRVLHGGFLLVPVGCEGGDHGRVAHNFGEGGDDL